MVPDIILSLDAVLKACMLHPEFPGASHWKTLQYWLSAEEAVRPSTEFIAVMVWLSCMVRPWSAIALLIASLTV